MNWNKIVKVLVGRSLIDILDLKIAVTSYFPIDVNLQLSSHKRAYSQAKPEHARAAGIILNVFYILYTKLFTVLMFLFPAIDTEFTGLNLNNETKNRYL